MPLIIADGLLEKNKHIIFELASVQSMALLALTNCRVENIGPQLQLIIGEFIWACLTSLKMLFLPEFLGNNNIGVLYMTLSDFEYDCLQKKSLARQSKYRKRGSRSGKCTLSTDYMTQKQWKERNGKVVSVNLHQPVSWEIFKSLSKSTQEEYLRNLMATYGANATSLADMFGVRPLTVRRHIQANELDIKFQVGHSMSAEQKDLWGEFLNNTPEQTQESEVKNATTILLGATAKHTNKKPSEKPEEEKMCMRKVSLGFKGPIDVLVVANSLTQILGSNSKGEIEIICNLW